MYRLLLAILVALLPAAVEAKWLEASSRHFVIYSDDQPNNIRRLSEQLERFHAAMTKLIGGEAALPSPSNRVTVYIVSSDSQVRRLAGDGQNFLYAFYVPRAGASIAIVPKVRAAKGDPSFSMIALLHEYAHHVTLSTSTAALPLWVVEGSAEFFASAGFGDDGSVDLGRPANHRAGELAYAADVPLKELFEPDIEERARQRDYDRFYGKSWLLFHYLTFSKARAAQLTDYLKQVGEGVRSGAAAEKSFGDFKVLDTELKAYLKAKTLTTLRLMPEGLEPGPIALRELGAGEAALMPVRIRSRSGVDRDQALALLPDVKKVAAKFPGDAAVLAGLAEAEYDAGHNDEAVAAADAALAIDPRLIDAHLQKGFALFAKAQTASGKAPAFRAARQPFIEINKLENDHPLPLVYYYLSFAEQSQKPNEVAMAGLRRAVELAPFDMNLRNLLAMQAIRDGNKAEAVANLKPIAYNPHGGGIAGVAARLIQRIESGASTEELLRDGGLRLAGESTQAKSGGPEAKGAAGEPKGGASESKKPADPKRRPDSKT